MNDCNSGDMMRKYVFACVFLLFVVFMAGFTTTDNVGEQYICN